jgi:hypothetical protein
MSDIPTEMRAGLERRPGEEVLASYDQYLDAQRAVDHLSDNRFPVEQLRIVGSDLELVEQVTGRLTKARAAGVGAVSGAWFGLLIGLLVGLFTFGPVWVGLLLGGLVIGAVGGAVAGFLAHWATGGQRDFSSITGVTARRFDLLCSAEAAPRARELLATLV